MALILGSSASAAGRALHSGQLALRRRLGLGEDDPTKRDRRISNPSIRTGSARSASSSGQTAAAHLTRGDRYRPADARWRRCLAPQAVLTAASLLVVVALVGVVTLGTRSLHHPGAAADGPSTQVEQEVEAVGVVPQLASGKYRAVAARYPPGSLPSRYPLRTKDQWQHCATAFGAYKSHGPPGGGGGSVKVPVATAHGDIDMSVNFDQNGRLSLSVARRSPRRIRSPCRGPTQRPRPGTLSPNYGPATTNRSSPASIPWSRRISTPGSLQTLWESFERAYGASVGQGQPVWSDGLGVDVPVTWAHASSHIVVFFDGNYDVSGLSLLLPDAPPTAIYGGAVAPSPATAAVATRMVDGLAAVSTAWWQPTSTPSVRLRRTRPTSNTPGKPRSDLSANCGESALRSSFTQAATFLTTSSTSNSHTAAPTFRSTSTPTTTPSGQSSRKARPRESPINETTIAPSLSAKGGVDGSTAGVTGLGLRGLRRVSPRPAAKFHRKQPETTIARRAAVTPPGGQRSARVYTYLLCRGPVVMTGILGVEPHQGKGSVRTACEQQPSGGVSCRQMSSAKMLVRGGVDR